MAERESQNLHASPSSEQSYPRSAGAHPYVSLVPRGPVSGAIRPPGSKSLTNRALILAALAKGRSILMGCLRSEDTDFCSAALRKLGVRIDDEGERWVVHGLGGSGWQPSPETIELAVGNSGTTIRFLAAALAALGGRYFLHGVPRMHQRPIGDLMASLNAMGVGAHAESPGGCPPVRLNSTGLHGGTVEIAGNVSSQFLSGLLMAAPLARHPVELHITNGLVSRSYVDMTRRIMEQFGVPTQWLEQDRLRIESPKHYQAVELEIEPDASAASYFWAVPAIAGGQVLVRGLTRQAWQGDVRFVECLAAMGCEVHEDGQGISVTGPARRGIDVDMRDISDTAQTLAAVAMTVHGSTRIRGIAHNRFKETDRIGDLARELRKLGAHIDEQDDGLSITPPSAMRPATLETYHDHRMAMSLSLLGLKHGEIKILNPACTAKTYPDFFADLERLTGHAHRWGSLA